MEHRVAFQSAMRSYNAMETTKRRHFDYLTMLESKKKKYNLNITADESTMLASLLQDHNDEVMAFKSRCDALKLCNAEAHKALFLYLAEINKAMALLSQTQGH